MDERCPANDPLAGMRYPNAPDGVTHAVLMTVHTGCGDVIEAWWELLSNDQYPLDVPVVPVEVSGPMPLSLLYSWARGVMHLTWGLHAVAADFPNETARFVPNPLGGWTQTRTYTLTRVAGAVH